MVDHEREGHAAMSPGYKILLLIVRIFINMSYPNRFTTVSISISEKYVCFQTSFSGEKRKDATNILKAHTADIVAAKLRNEINTWQVGTGR